MKKIFIVIPILLCAVNLAAQNDWQPKIKTISLKTPAIQPVKLPGIFNKAMPVLDPGTRLKELKLLCPAIQAAQPYIKLEGRRWDHKKVNLEWVTKNASSFDKFYLQRSLGDSLHFETVSESWAKKTNGFRDLYRNTDDNSYNKISYYRIKVLLENGDYIVSNQAEVKGYTSTVFRLFPNPASEYLNIEVSSIAAGEGMVTIYDVNGKKLKLQRIKLAEGINQGQVIISNLRPGSYTVEILLPDQNKLAANFVKL